MHQQENSSQILVDSYFIENQLIKFIVMSQSEYRLVEDYYFLDFCRALSAKKDLISRHRLSDIIKESVPQVKERIISELRSATSVALTFDTWSPRKCSAGFAATTAHYFSNEMVFHFVIFHIISYLSSSLLTSMLFCLFVNYHKSTCPGHL